MKTIAVFLVQTYQSILSPMLRNVLGISRVCRYEISCSEYAKKAIEKQGIVEGIRLSTLRILSCQPFTKITI